jgi:cysteine synthase B
VVRARESLEATRRLLSEAGLFVGISTGAALAGAIRCANQIPDGQSAVIVIISADDGWKYLSTGAWTDDIDVVTKRAEKILYF